MGLKKLVKRYKNKLARRFSRRIERKQVNFRCDIGIISGVKLMAKSIEVPYYILIEHLLQLGATEVGVIMQEPALREQLCRHLVQDHLLVPVTQAEPKVITRQVARIKNALELVKLFETAKNPEEISSILKRVTNEVMKKDMISNE